PLVHGLGVVALRNGKTRPIHSVPAAEHLHAFRWRAPCLQEFLDRGVDQAWRQFPARDVLHSNLQSEITICLAATRIQSRRETLASVDLGPSRSLSGDGTGDARRATEQPTRDGCLDP